MTEPKIKETCGNCLHYNVLEDYAPCLDCSHGRIGAPASKFEPIIKGLEHAYDEQMVEAHEILAEDSIEPVSALSIQEGGSHYKGFAIQPVVYNHRNGIGYLEGNVIKYVSRHKAKNGKEDILKARHYLDLLLELEYGDTA